MLSVKEESGSADEADEEWYGGSMNRTKRKNRMPKNAETRRHLNDNERRVRESLRRHIKKSRLEGEKVVSKVSCADDGFFLLGELNVNGDVVDDTLRLTLLWSMLTFIPKAGPFGCPRPPFGVCLTTHRVLCVSSNRRSLPIAISGARFCDSQVSEVSEFLLIHITASYACGNTAIRVF